MQNNGSNVLLIAKEDISALSRFMQAVSETFSYALNSSTL